MLLSLTLTIPLQETSVVTPNNSYQHMLTETSRAGLLFHLVALWRK
jgi:hypothetical protein